MAKNQQNETPKLDVITQQGIARYPKLNAPDTYKGKSTYNVQLVVDPSADGLIGKKPGNVLEAAQKMLDEYVPALRQQLKDKVADLKAAKKMPQAKELEKKIESLEVAEIGKTDYDDDGEETGLVIIKAKMNSEFKDRKTGELRQRSPVFFDSKNKALKPVPQIWGGTKMKLACTMMPYYVESSNSVGITFYLNAVQVIDLVSGGGRTAEAYGFGEEDGYEGAADDAAPFAADDADSSDDANF